MPRRYAWRTGERGSPGGRPCPRRGCCSPTTCPTSTRTPATAGPPPAGRPASPTASSTTGRAPAWSSPSVRPAGGSGTQRLYSFRDILVLKVVKRLLDTGVSLQQIRVAVQALRERGVDDLAQITLMSDGASVYECTSADEVIDLVQGGQGVFGIAVGRVWREVEGELAQLPSERAERRRRRRRQPADELGSRRAARWPDAPARRCADGRLTRRHTAWERPRRSSSGRRRGKPPRNLSGARTHGTGTSGAPARA